MRAASQILLQPSLKLFVLQCNICTWILQDFIFIGLIVSAALFEIGFNNWIVEVIFEGHKMLLNSLVGTSTSI